MSPLGLSPETLQQLRTLRGLVATCVTTGAIDPDFAAAREELRAFNIEHNFRNVEYRTFNCVLVEAGRDEVAAHAMAQNYDWVLQIDADAAPFAPDAVVRLLHRAYIELPESDAIGAYSQLKQAPYLPTIDTGTGTWEVHYPGEGVLEVIRTGGHFFLTKVPVYRRILASGARSIHRTRVAPTPAEILLELDNLARTRFSGKNPFRHMPEWEELTEYARARSDAKPANVGEDSGFCDNLRAVGGRLFVDTDLVAGHVAKVTITPAMLREEIEKREEVIRKLCGIGA